MDADLIDQYRRIHQTSPGYGLSAAHGARVAAQARTLKCDSVLDYGCGKGALVRDLRQRLVTVDVAGFDPAVGEWSDDSSLQRRWDMVTCIDVAEHFAVGTVKPNLVKIKNCVGKALYIVVSCRPAKKFLPDGRNAHLSVHEKEWWRSRLEEVFGPVWCIEELEWAEGNRAATFRVIRSEGRLNIDSLEILKLNHLALDSGPGTVAIVGNGPVTVGDRQRIDDADCVIRFNDWNRRKNYQEALYGKRCDLLFTQFDANHNPDLTNRPKAVCIAIPYPFHVDHIVEKAEQWFRDSQLVMYNPYIMRLICRDVLYLRDSEGWQHPIPTVGFQMLFQLQRWQAKNCEVFVTGFNWQVDPNAGTAGTVPLESDDLPRHFNHSYLRELKWCARNLASSPQWSFSTVAQAALEAVRPFA